MGSPKPKRRATKKKAKKPSKALPTRRKPAAKKVKASKSQSMAGLSPIQQKVVTMRSVTDLKSLLTHAKKLSWFKPGQKIEVCDKMQRDYSYTLKEKVGQNFAEKFKPHYTPAEMLAMGVFEGKYLNDCVLELPREWLQAAVEKDKLRPGRPSYNVNEFQIKSRSSLQQWRENQWIPCAEGDEDPRGWFQWYCRYYLGRREPVVDTKQINRWNAIKRHRGQVLASYKRMEEKFVPKTKAAKREHRPRQRQCLLQWSYNPYC